MGNTSSQKLTGGGGGSCGSGHWRRNRAWTPPAAVSSDHQPPSPVVGAQLAERHLEGRGVPEADEALIEAVARTVLLPPGDVDGAGIDHQPLPRRAGDGGIAEGGGGGVRLEIYGVGELLPAGLAVREVHLPGDLGIVRGDLLDDVAGLVVAVDAEPGRLLAHLPTAVLEPFGARIGRPPRHLPPSTPPLRQASWHPRSRVRRRKRRASQRRRYFANPTRGWAAGERGDERRGRRPRRPSPVTTRAGGAGGHPTGGEESLAALGGARPPTRTGDAGRLAAA